MPSLSLPVCSPSLSPYLQQTALFWNALQLPSCVAFLQLKYLLHKQSQRKSKLIGTRQSDDSSIKAGVNVVRKSFVHNLDIDCTSVLLSDYLLANDVSVLSCHATKSWMRDEDKESHSLSGVCQC